MSSQDGINKNWNILPPSLRPPRPLRLPKSLSSFLPHESFSLRLSDQPPPLSSQSSFLRLYRPNKLKIVFDPSPVKIKINAKTYLRHQNLRPRNHLCRLFLRRGHHGSHGHRDLVFHHRNYGPCFHRNPNYHHRRCCSKSHRPQTDTRWNHCLHWAYILVLCRTSDRLAVIIAWISTYITKQLNGGIWSWTHFGKCCWFVIKLRILYK